MAASADVAVHRASVALVLRFRGGKWKSMRVIETTPASGEPLPDPSAEPASA